MGVSIDTGGKGGKKPLDAELNLVPFIDLLVCCICFLLITAVWTQMHRINVKQSGKSQATENNEPPKPKLNITVLVGEDGYTITAGPERLDIPKSGDVYDAGKLGERLRDIKTRFTDKEDITVSVEDGVAYRFVVEAMDIALQQHFTQLKVTDARNSQASL
jgi:biopolymer transport protein TolR